MSSNRTVVLLLASQVEVAKHLKVVVSCRKNLELSVPYWEQ
jgi:hypothetical protein